jgi:hypothetical protein
MARRRRVWVSLCVALLLIGVARARATRRTAASPPEPRAGVLSESASSAFERARREQALMRAEATVEMLRALAAAPVLAGAGP